MLNTFTNPISDYRRFNTTNELWNKLYLNASWSVGTTTTLIKQRHFQTKEDWETFYFESGRERLAAIEQLPTHQQSMLLSPSKPYAVDAQLAKLNYAYGRTKRELAHQGTKLFQALEAIGNPEQFTLAECQLIAWYRIIGETWNGVMLREQAARQFLNDFFSKQKIEVSIVDTAGVFDSKYAVDFELYAHGQIFCGVQVKPQSYLSTSSYVEKAKAINAKKNQAYTQIYNRPVLYLFLDKRNQIINPDILQTLPSIPLVN